MHFEGKTEAPITPALAPGASIRGNTVFFAQKQKLFKLLKLYGWNDGQTKAISSTLFLNFIETGGGGKNLIASHLQGRLNLSQRAVRLFFT